MEGLHPGVSTIIYCQHTTHELRHTAHECVVYLPNVSLSQFGERVNVVCVRATAAAESGSGNEKAQQGIQSKFITK